MLPQLKARRNASRSDIEGWLVVWAKWRVFFDQLKEAGGDFFSRAENNGFINLMQGNAPISSSKSSVLSNRRRDKIMKRCLLALSMLALLASTGCHLRRDCNQCGVATGCRPCTMGWQRGGTDYQSHISHSRYPHHAQAQSGGPTAATVGYPYYTTRGPRDFLVDNPPSIGR